MNRAWARFKIEMNFLLSGGGDYEYFNKLEKRFIEELPKNAKIALLPFACDQEDYKELYADFRENMENKKVEQVDLIDNIESISLEKFLDYDAIYIEGGNTFQLVTHVRNTCMNQYLQEFVKRNKIVYADSAGAIVLGQNIQSAFIGDSADEDEAKLQDYRGLGLIDNYSLHCHAEEADFSVLQDLLYESGCPFLALAEPTGIHIKGDTIEVFGAHELEILDFEGRKQFPVGKKFNFA